MKRVKISQSLIKDLEKYFDGQKCGHLVYEQYVNGVYSDPTDAMRQGIYFEYLATGALPKGGKVPEPDYLKDGVTLSAEYRRAKSQAELFKSLVKEMGIEIQAVGVTTEANGMVGTCDILAKWEGREIIIDLKYSGFINNDFEELGWGDLYGKNDRGKQYRHHSCQSLQYQYLFDRPFYFWVFSSVNVGETVMIEMVHDEEQLAQHVERASNASKSFMILSAHEKAGLAAIPEYNTCKKCPIYGTCEFRANLPIPKQVTYQP